jgi:sarcosine oxidase subunit beta
MMVPPAHGSHHRNGWRTLSMAHPSERRADVVVIGGGVIGASVAFHLARRGCRDVVVLERGRHPGQGSTGRATGGFRAQFATPVNVALSLLAREKLRRFHAEVGADAGYRECGYLFAAGSEAQLETLRAAQRVQHAAGLHEAVELTADEVLARNPAIRGDDVVGGVFCPTDGFLRPLHMLGGYGDAAQQLGATFTYGAEVRALRMEGDRVTAVETSRGTVHAGVVVNAAGAWAAEVARMAGVELPVTPVRRQVAATAYTDVLPSDMPMTIFTDDGFHLRVRDGRVLLLWPGPALPHREADIAFDRDWLPEVVTRAHRRVPCLADVPLDHDACAAGLYEVSPDGHAILGLAPGVRNLYLANGSSGHGVMHAPALGHLLAEQILDGRITTIDARPLRPERFAEGDGCTVPDLF